MNTICVDDEKLILENTVAMCKELPQIDKVKGFTRAADALAWLDRHEVHLALLDINLPDVDGIQLAERIKEKSPDTAIIFLTGYAQYAVDAFAIHAFGYILKPVEKERLEENVEYVLSQKNNWKKQTYDNVEVRTFGNFDVYVNGEPMHFKIAKCKELLAYLVDKQGTGVTRKEVFSVLWEDRQYDRKMQKQLDVYIRNLRETLREYGIADIFEMEKGVLRIRPEAFACDAYRFFDGDSSTINSYRGEYMNSYTWASITESIMYWRVTRAGGGGKT